MKKPLKYFNRYCVFAIIITNVVSAMIGYYLGSVIKGETNAYDLEANLRSKTNQKDCSNSDDSDGDTATVEEPCIPAECPDYIVRSNYTYLNKDSSVALPLFDIMTDGNEVWEKANSSIHDSFFDWMPEVFKGAEQYGSYIMLSTNKYLSIMNDYIVSGDGDYHFYQTVCNTIDMETGEVIYLDDLVYVDEELVELILTPGIVKLDTFAESLDDGYTYSKEDLEKKDPAWILMQLQECSIPYTSNHFGDKPTFYLRYNRLYLLSIFTEESEFYIELDKIQDKLKTERW